jgi:ligand-binding sensor domain-containing protein
LTGKYGIDDRDIHNVLVDRFGSKVYAQTSVEFFEYDSLVQRWYSVGSPPDIETEDKPIDPPKVMFAPPGFNYLNDGRLVDNFGRFYSLEELIEDGSGQIWLGTWGFGGGTASGSSGTIELLRYGLLQSRVNAIFCENGYLWVSGAVFNEMRTGISIFDAVENSFEYIESGFSRDFPSADINCMAGNESSIFVGTEVGIIVIDKGSLQPINRINRKHGLSNDNIIALTVRGDSIFVGTAEGLNLVTFADDSVSVVGPIPLLDDIIFDLEIIDTTLWVASSSGAFRWYWNSDRLQQYQDPNLVIFSQCLAVERWKNYLWLGSNDGLVKLDLETGETTPFRSVTSNRDYRALAVNDTIAVMTSSRGMSMLFHKNKKPFEREFTTDDGLPSSNVFELKIDGDFVWIGTDRGLTRFWWNNPSRVD